MAKDFFPGGLRRLRAALGVLGLTAMVTAQAGQMIYQEDFDNPAYTVGSVPPEMGLHSPEGSQIGISQDQHLSGARSLRFKLTRQSNKSFRSEVVLTHVPDIANYIENNSLKYKYEEEYWVGFSEYLDHWAPDTVIESVAQAHASDYPYGDIARHTCVIGGVPKQADNGLNAYTLVVMKNPNNPGSFELTMRPRQDGTCPPKAGAFPGYESVEDTVTAFSDVWINWAFHFKMSLAGAGYWQIYRNGTLVYDSIPAGLQTNAQGQFAVCCDETIPAARRFYYPKFGIYKPGWKNVSSDVPQRMMYLDNIKIWAGTGGSLIAVSPSLGGTPPRSP